MNYDIESKSDYINGVSLTVKVPEDELDKKALYTIQADRPKFILPFNYRSIDGRIEFVYQIGAQSKLLYLSGSRSGNEYTLLWSGLLTPLLNCGDWFMKPYSFVLNIEHLYYDRSSNSVCYIYIPTISDCSRHTAIKEMASEFSKYISVADADLENMVLRAIMRDFNPKDLLQMLEQYSNASSTSIAVWSAREQAPARFAGQVDLEQPEISYPELERIEPCGGISRTSGDIFISIPKKGKTQRAAEAVITDLKDADGNKGKEQKRSKSGRGLFGGRKNRRQEADIEPVYRPPAQAREPACSVEPTFAAQTDMPDITQSITTASSGSGFRLVGSALLPPIIDVRIPAGGIFTIGRYDAVIGRQQSSFEFDKKTKAVSRRHAAVERGGENYRIIDLSSSAGTYLNGQKLPPNTPFELCHGCRVSFGNAGADYVWEE